MFSVPPAAGAGGALVLVLGLAAGMATRLATARGRGRSAGLRQVSLYLLLGAALLLLHGAPPGALDPEDRFLTALLTVLIAGGMLASDAGALLGRLFGRRP